MKDSIRSQKLTLKLDELNIPYTIIEAIDGSKLSDEELSTFVDFQSCEARLGYKISKNLIGCYLSHAKAYKLINESNIPWSLVLEEDVIMQDLKLDKIEQVIYKIVSEPTIVQLFTRSSRLIYKNSINSLGDGYIYFKFRTRLVGSGASAYLINKTAIELALSHRLVSGAPDWPAWASKVNFLGIYPWMFEENSTGTLIPNNQINRIPYVLRRFSQLTGMHFLRYRRSYMSLSIYLNEEIYPYLIYILWRLKGCKTYQNTIDGPQVF